MKTCVFPASRCNIYNQPLDDAQILALRGALLVRAGAELVVDFEATCLMCTRTAIDETPGAANSLGIASIKTDCGRVAQGNPTPNERIACAKAALGLAELVDPTVDPTGLAAIASAFLHPNCP